ncbi:MAG: hypothetical protein HY268_34365 [Deltaproteobacteria bacterium]|nr:hypothetical protein [Deltaproteobacteria bacterium]
MKKQDLTGQDQHAREADPPHKRAKAKQVLKSSLTLLPCQRCQDGCATLGKGSVAGSTGF